MKESIFGDMMNVPRLSRIKILCPSKILRDQGSVSQRRQSKVKRGKPQKREAVYGHKTAHCTIWPSSLEGAQNLLTYLLSQITPSLEGKAEQGLRR